MLSPKESGNLIAKKSELVSINQQGISSLSQQIFAALKDGTLSISNLLSQGSFPVGLTEEKLVNWLFVVDTLNFCFWPINGGNWEVNAKGQVHTGYFALCAALDVSNDSEVDMTNPAYYSQMNLNDLQKLLQIDYDPLLKQRLDALHQVGNMLLENYNGSFANCVKECDKSAQKLLQLIVTKFPCFNDVAEYKGLKVSFYKRAQILIADLWTTFDRKSYGEFHDIDTITMFADYRVPQVLVHFGVLEYKKKLKDILNEGQFQLFCTDCLQTPYQCSRALFLGNKHI
ncbi:queuosine salvage protein [Nilaparvata lugens]|uniref:queuosine salvage protein n=1 Tax=Nilaparvata lugens TaxID=108931 RepID=UPI00193DE60E|nr:queuosine salvage protein [Nilaparvata lugens]XP_039278442.1 queuosine salvage protein [Nilaparvata lugens]XP_039278443.1 queuosine salvage protein [Nilaparvata lugens]